MTHIEACLSAMMRASEPHGIDADMAHRIATEALESLHDALLAQCDLRGVSEDVAHAMFAALGGAAPSRNVESPLPDTEASRALRDAEVRGVAAMEAALRDAERSGLARRGVIRGACGEFSVYPARLGEMAVYQGEVE